MDKQALRPNLYQDYHKEVLETTEESFETDDKFLHAISGERGWLIIKDYMLSAIDQIDAMVFNAVSQGAPSDYIGQLTTTSVLTKQTLQNIIGRVEDAKEIIESKNRGGTGGEGGEAEGESAA